MFGEILSQKREFYNELSLASFPGLYEVLY